MRKKKKGAESRQPTAPERKGKAKRLFDSKRKGLETQEAELFLKFAEFYPSADMKIEVALAVWNFMEFLKSNHYYIVNGQEVFCVPFSKLARKGDLR